VELKTLADREEIYYGYMIRFKELVSKVRVDEITFGLR
jgi:hypothetical protein